MLLQMSAELQVKPSGVAGCRMDHSPRFQFSARFYMVRETPSGCKLDANWLALDWDRHF